MVGLHLKWWGRTEFKPEFLLLPLLPSAKGACLAISAWSRAEETQLIRSLEVAHVCNSTNISLAIRRVYCITWVSVEMTAVKMAVLTELPAREVGSWWCLACWHESCFSKMSIWHNWIAIGGLFLNCCVFKLFEKAFCNLINLKGLIRWFIV